MTDASVTVEARMEDKAYKRGVDKLIKDLDKAELKLKEFNIEGTRGSTILGALTKGADGFGAGIIGALTGAIAMSPQFKQFLGELKGPMFELSDELGERMQPALDQALSSFESFVNTVSQSSPPEYVNLVNDALIETIRLLGLVAEFPFDPQGTVEKQIAKGKGISAGIVPPVTEGGRNPGGVFDYVDAASRNETFGSKMFGGGYLGVGTDIITSNPVLAPFLGLAMYNLGKSGAFQTGESVPDMIDRRMTSLWRDLGFG